MSRTRGEFNMTTNYDVSVKKPFDARMLVPTYSDLLDENNWYKYDPATQSITTVWIAYNGMIVAVADTDNPISNGLYMLFDATNKKKPSVVAENWIKIGDLSDVESRLSALEAIELPEGITIEQVQDEVNVLREELESAGYLTKDDLAEYALQTDVADAVAASKAYTDDALNDYVTSDVFAEEVSKLVTDQELEDAIKAIDYSTYATKEEVNAKLDVSVYNTDKDTFALKGTTLASYGIKDAYTAADVDAKIAKAVTEGKVDLDGYVTTTDLAEVTENIDAVSTKAEANEAQIALINPALNELRGAITYGEF